MADENRPINLHVPNDPEFSQEHVAVIDYGVDIWKRFRRHPGAVAGMVGCLGAMEVIKLLTGLGQPLLGRLLACDLRAMSFRTVKTTRRPDCRACGAG